MTLQQIHYAITISEMGSMNKASEALFISQPSLTNAIRELEKEVGITIFMRTGKGAIPTKEGEEFLLYARQLYQQYELIHQKYVEKENVKRKFGVSTQHYSFATKAFVETVKHFDTLNYEFAIRETKTFDVIQDVGNLKSEVGLLFMNDFNRKVITKMLKNNECEFHNLIDCNAYVYIWKRHPLADKQSITFDELRNYPCLSFEQGENGSFYFAEEILSTNDYQRTIKATDRASMLNLMIGLNGYTLCSGIICEELNGSDYLAVPFEADEDNPNSSMEIGYIVKKGRPLTEIGKIYIDEIKKYLNTVSQS
ncbi:MAG: LysR family transcriptional regulator [Firmicutes bacterium]|nr:LysR family transcriptional regulator [Bacillota bacterium]